MKPTTDGRWAHLSCAMWIPGMCFLQCFFAISSGSSAFIFSGSLIVFYRRMCIFVQKLACLM